MGIHSPLCHSRHSAKLIMDMGLLQFTIALLSGGICEKGVKTSAYINLAIFYWISIYELQIFKKKTCTVKIILS